MFRSAGAGVPGLGRAGDGPASLGRESCACAESASNDIAETAGMMIFMRLDALMRARPLLFRWPWCPVRSANRRSPG